MEEERVVDKTPSQMTDDELRAAIAAALGADAPAVFAALADAVHAGLTTDRMALMIAWTDIQGGRAQYLVAAAARDPHQRRTEHAIKMEVEAQLRKLRGIGWGSDVAQMRLRATVAGILMRHFPTVRRVLIAQQVAAHVTFDGTICRVRVEPMIEPFWRRHA